MDCSSTSSSGSYCENSSGFAHLSTLNPNANSLQKQLIVDLDRQIYGNIEVPKFVKSVFGLGDDEIKAILSHNFRHDLAAVFNYNEILESSQHESNLYEPFRQMCYSLLDAYLAAHHPQEARSIQIWQDPTTNVHSKTVGPGRVTVWTAATLDGAVYNLNCVQSPIEFKRRKRRKMVHIDSPTRKALSESMAPLPRKPRELFGVSRPRNVKSSGAQGINPPMQRLPQLHTIDESSDDSTSSDINVATGSKRRRSVEDVGGRANFTQDEFQLALYASKCFEASSRFYVVGLYIKHWTISIWYYDRMGAIRTVSFEFSVNDAHMLGFLLVALHKSDATNSGFSPFLHARDPTLYSTTNAVFASPSHVSPEIGNSAPSGERHSRLPPYEMKGAVLRFPCAGTDDDGHEATGYRLVGRGTEAYSCYELFPVPKKNPKKLVIKLAWSSISRTPEQMTLKNLLTRALELKRYLPDVVFAFLWLNEKVSGVHFEKRNLVVIAMKRYQPLWEARTLEEFKRVFVDILECHHRAYKKGRYLHRDISDTNLMMDRLEDGSVMGILSDWDLSSAVDDHGSVASPNSRHRTGTYPFLAADLLTENPPEHLYRHDLESFFYILIWAGLHHSLNGKETPADHPAVKLLVLIAMVEKLLLIKNSKKTVVKLAWPSTCRAPETQTLRSLSTQTPELRRYLPDVVFACVYDSDADLHLPRYKMLSTAQWLNEKISGVEFEKRNLVVIAMKQYQPLWEARTLDEFKKAFVDALECHHRAYKKGRYLHRDISETNLMMDRLEDGSVVGVLSDWDLSSPVDDHGSIAPLNSERTGTYPFLAADLLTDTPPEHLYRHDLESFFYVLIWLGLHYSLNGEALPTVHPEVKAWDDDDCHDSAQKDKRRMFISHSGVEDFCEEFNPSFAPLVDQWIIPLHTKVFHPAFLRKEEFKYGSDPTEYDDITLDGLLTFENFMEAIGETPRTESEWDEPAPVDG
ncbi:hypothetical protein BDP27DRAFT_1491029 [Rhodocollybia butyracea]|uniref:Fungal-type protein kinase domain-containing protein n=1 Tax=Rhodocollybia butyracea TaxID=206335 RepID=A0A9P5U0V2_9AGAR|nr:hypothetical protein BDP27DRAFT_1491029 [Rhodocollybia butyracea]